MFELKSNLGLKEKLTTGLKVPNSILFQPGMDEPESGMLGIGMAMIGKYKVTPPATFMVSSLLSSSILHPHLKINNSLHYHAN